MKWLGEEALKRYQRLRGNFAPSGRKEVVSDVRKTRGGAILDPQDLIREVLDDNDFVSVGKSRRVSYSHVLFLHLVGTS